MLSANCADCSDSLGRTKIRLQKPVFFDVNTGETVFLKGGLAYNDNNKPYSGTIRHNNLTLTYKNGKITKSTKDGKPYKEYHYDLLRSPKVSFSDGSSLPEDEYWDYPKTETVRIYTNTNDTTTMSSIFANKNAKHKGEPVLRINRGYGAKTFLKETGEGKPVFNSASEASKYFMKEYGIYALFDNLAQAHLAKNAVDDFVALNIKGLGKKVFEGLFIRTAKLNKNTVANHNCRIFIGYDDDFMQNAFLNSKDSVDFITKHKPDKMELQANRILLNTDFDWSSPFESEENYNSKQHSHYKIKSHIQHELAHYLHSKFSPYEYILARKMTEHDKAIAKEVSNYAAKDECEFVAEYLTGRLAGHKYSDNANALYKKCGGIDIF